MQEYVRRKDAQTQRKRTSTTTKKSEIMHLPMLDFAPPEKEMAAMEEIVDVEKAGDQEQEKEQSETVEHKTKAEEKEKKKKKKKKKTGTKGKKNGKGKVRGKSSYEVQGQASASMLRMDD